MKVKYRLEAAQKNTSMWADDGGEPDSEQIELSAKYSWEYVDKLKGFYIYRTYDLSARELNTDSEVQALALNHVEKKQREAIINSLILFVIYPLIFTHGSILITTITMGTWWVVLALVLVVLMIANEVRGFIHLKKVQKSLINEGYYSADSAWRNNVAKHYSKKLIKSVMAVVLVCAFFKSLGASITDENKIFIDEYAGELPFATITDFAGEGSQNYELTMTGLSMGVNTIEEKTDFLAPRFIKYNEHAKVQKTDGSFIDGGLYIDYCELKNPTLAKIFANELYRVDKRNKHYEPVEIPELAADYVVAYINDLYVPTVIMRKGNIVVKAFLFQSSESYTLPIEEWTKIICESIY